MRHWFPIAAIAVALALAVGLYRAKTDAQAARARVAELSREVRDMKAEVQALRAEAAHLESPANVEALARRNLDLDLTRPAQVRPEADIEEALPPARTR